MTFFPAVYVCCCPIDAGAVSIHTHVSSVRPVGIRRPITLSCSSRQPSPPVWMHTTSCASCVSGLPSDSTRSCELSFSVFLVQLGSTIRFFFFSLLRRAAPPSPKKYAPLLTQKSRRRRVRPSRCRLGRLRLRPGPSGGGGWTCCQDGARWEQQQVESRRFVGRYVEPFKLWKNFISPFFFLVIFGKGSG